MTTTDAYSKFFEDSSVPVLFQKWLLDIVCQDGLWDITFVRKDAKIIGLWFFYKKKKMGLSYITMPSAVKYMGPILIDGLSKVEENNVCQQLFKSLPSRSYLIQQLQPRYTDRKSALESQPLLKYSLRTSYYLDFDKSEADLLSQMDGNYRRAINKYSSELIVENQSVSTEAEIASFIDLLKLNLGSLEDFNIQKKTIRELIHAAEARKTGKLLLLSHDKTTIAGALILWDDTRSYYLYAANDHSKKKLYPGIQMVWKSIKYLKTTTTVSEMDMMGSSIESIAKVWAKFGAQKVSYPLIEQRGTFVFRLLNSIKTALSK